MASDPGEMNSAGVAAKEHAQQFCMPDLSGCYGRASAVREAGEVEPLAVAEVLLMLGGTWGGTTLGASQVEAGEYLRLAALPVGSLGWFDPQFGGATSR